MDNSYWFLEGREVETLVCPDKMSDYQKSHETATFKKGEYIFYNKKKSVSIYYVLKGRVMLGTYTDTNQEVPTTILQQGDIFGQISEINNSSRDDYALASSDVALFVMSIAELKLLLLDESLVNILMMKMMASRVKEMEFRLQSLMFKDSRSRIIEFIVRSMEKSGQRVGYEWLIRGFSTHMEVASITATSRQTVTMIMNELRNDNIIHFDRKRLLVRDLDKLKSYIAETKS